MKTETWKWKRFIKWRLLKTWFVCERVKIETFENADTVFDLFGVNDRILNALVWTGENDTNHFVWTKIFCYVFGQLERLWKRIRWGLLKPRLHRELVVIRICSVAKQPSLPKKVGFCVNSLCDWSGCFTWQASRMTISKLASDVAENHWETKGMKHALLAERDYNLMTTQKMERLKVRNAYSLGWRDLLSASIYTWRAG